MARLVFALTATLFCCLLPAQDDDGWIDLFDGKTLNGWRQLNGTATYEVVDGTILGTTARGSPNSFLCTEQFFGDFELLFEVKLMNDQLNSGVQIRSHSYPAYKNSRVHGYQVEISTNGNAGFIYDEARRKWLSKDRNDQKARTAFVRGEWNRYRVVCNGSSIRTWINDVPVAKVDDDWAANGFIGLQVHSVGRDPKWQVAWRNIRLKPIGDGGGWNSLFDGRDLKGWRVSENPDSVRVEGGAMIVGGGPRAHVFYDGPVYFHSFKNFELSLQIRTEPKANSGVYFHTAFQETGWPSQGYEVQVNNTHRDPKKTGGLYAIQDVSEPPTKDREWFEMKIKVQGKHVVVHVNGKVTADYTEPAKPERNAGMAGRILSRGTIAFQAHDPGSIVRYRNIRVKMLPE